MNTRKLLLTAAASLLAGVATLAQAPDSLTVAPDTLLPAPVPEPVRTLDEVLSEAEGLHRDYRFEQAAALFGQALRMTEDSLARQGIEDRLLQAQNGRNMLGYCSQPSVVARQRFSLEDFFLYYPLKDRSWRPVPNQLDSLDGGDLVRAMYIPDGETELYYSAADADGIHNIYRTHLQDTVWSVPELINETLTSSSDEIFPMLSPDGNSLYFSSKGLYGMGGYDLYVSRWNRETHDWETPVNLGFPYSSPADDFLFMNTPDGKYSLFASNRECARDSVWLYVLEYDGMPVRKALTDPQEVKTLSRLLPDGDPSRLENRGAVAALEEGVDTRRYTEKMRQVRQLRDSIYLAGQSIDAARAGIAAASEEARRNLAADILRREEALTALQDSLSVAVRELQQIEMDFLSSGVVLDPGKLQQEADREVVGAASGYAFSRKEMGDPVRMNILKPKPTFDYSFMILPEGRFAEDNTLPDGLVYQIQLFTSSTPATVKQLRGLSPVFSKMSAQLRHTYSVGVFRSYKDVLANLNKVKRQGFRSAFIVAFQDGVSIPVAKAREAEKNARPSYQIRITPADGVSLGDSTILSIRAMTLKDLSKEAGEAGTTYVLGPFDDRAEADRVLSSLRTIGLTAELF
ncbi:MAG: PD40 domain-containing protein [Bacteroidales bacterium]|nr:PD40 domain-containing protein [Bacteroidales bacterium]